MFERRSTPPRWPRRFFDWLCAGREDYREFQERKASRCYRARRSLCVWIWLGSGCLMLICPGGACLIPLFLAATFLSFAVLDEN
jgi:hypothetical protein